MRTILFVLALLGATAGRAQIFLDWYGAAAPPAPVTPLLDDYPAARGYSLRLLRTAYTGNCVEVRRSNDNALQDIGFAGGVIDTAALKTFCSSNDCFVRTWYDQSGNASNATSTAADANQPFLVRAGVVVRSGGEPAIESTTNVHRFAIASVTVNSVFVVAQVNTRRGLDVIVGTTATPANGVYYGGSNAGVTGIGMTVGVATIQSTIEDLNEHLTAAHFNASTDELFVDGVSQGTGTVATFNSNALLRSSATNYISGYIKEIVIYTTDQLSNNSGIQSNINAFYTIY